MFESLQSEITMETREFSRGTDRAEQDMSSLQRQADQTASKFESVGGRLKSLGQTLTLGVTLPLAAVGAKSLQTASEVEEMHAKMETVFQDQTAEVQAWADSFADATNRSSLQLEEMATALQDTFVPLGFARDEAADMSKQVAELAVDLSSFNDMPMDEALRRLRGGLTGSHENFREFGVIINQTSLGKQLEEQFGVGMDAATEQQKALARLQLVLEGTEDAQGDAARTSESFANQLRGMTGTLREVGVIIGQQLMPMATDIIGVIKGAAESFAGLDENVQRLIVGLGVAAAALGPVLAAIGVLITLPISGPMLAAGAAIAGLGATLFAFKDDLDGASETAATFRDMIGDAIGRVRASVDRHAGDIAESFAKIGGAIKAVIESRAFAIFADAILGLLTTVLDGVLTFVNIVGKLLTGDFRGALEEWLGSNKRAFRGFLEFIDKWTDGFASTFVNGIIRGMNRGSGAIEEFVREIPGFADFELGTIDEVDFGDDDDGPSTGPMSDPGGAPALGRTAGTGQGTDTNLFGGSGGAGAGGTRPGVETPGTTSALTAEDLHELARERDGELRPSDVGLTAAEFNRILSGGGGGGGTRSSGSGALSQMASLTPETIAEAVREALAGLGVHLSTDDPTLERVIQEEAELVYRDEQRRQHDRQRRATGAR